MASSEQALPDDILALILDHYIIPQTGYDKKARQETLRALSLTCSLLARLSRRHVFSSVTIRIGTRETDERTSTPAERLQALLKSNPAYIGYVEDLQIDAYYFCTAVGKDDDSGSDANNLGPSSVKLNYTSSNDEETSICWCLCQNYPNLKSFGISLFPGIVDDAQLELRRAAFTDHNLLVQPTWWDWENKPKEEWTQGTHFQEALLLWFLSRRTFEHLSVTPNIPPYAFEFCKATGIKRLTISKLDDPLHEVHESEVPIFLGIKWGGSQRESSGGGVETKVEEIFVDETSEMAHRWIHPFTSFVPIQDIKKLHFHSAKAGDGHWGYMFPSDKYSHLESVSLYGLEGPHNEIDWYHLDNLREVSLAINARDTWASTQLELTLQNIISKPNRPLERLELLLRVAKPDDGQRNPIKDFLRYPMSTLIKLKWKVPSLRELTIVLVVQSDEWHLNMDAGSRPGYWGPEFIKQEVETGLSGFRRAFANVKVDSRVEPLSRYPEWNVD